MKFSCPNCTAKYQIADEKVAGRTVKMKCRKCGTVIPIVAQPSKSSMARAPVVHAHSLKPHARKKAPPTVPAQAAPAEWHAGIGGSAKGPLTLAELQKFVDDGAVTVHTYVWKEGMDGWKPLSEVDELRALVSYITAPGPPSMPAQAKAIGPAKKSPGLGLAPAPKPTFGRKDPAGKKVTLPKPTLPKPSTPQPSAVAEKAAAAKVPQSSPAAAEVPESSPVAAEAAQSSPLAAEPSPPSSTGVVASDPLIRDASEEESSSAAARANAEKDAEAPLPEISLPGEGPYVANQQPSYDSLLYRLQKKRHNPYAIPIAVAGALVLGLALGMVFFGDQETKIVKQIVEVPAKVSEAAQHKKEVEQAEARAAAAQAEEEQEEETAVQQQASNSTKPSTNKPASNGSNDTPTATQVSEGLKGLTGLQGLDGPTAGPTGPSTTTGGGRPLESSQIQSTVSKYRTSVKRGCWQPALDSRDKDAPSSARVTVSIKVASSGSVTSATTSGDPRGYRGLASCISSKVRGWRFPVSSGATTVNVPFVFAAQ